MRTRPTDKPRLDALDPRTVADDVQRECVEHLHRQAFRLGFEARDTGLSNLHPEVLALVEFAQRGSAWDWQGPGDAWDAANELAGALYSAPGSSGDAGELFGDADPETAIGCVLVAIHARVRIDQGAAITTRQIAVLASLEQSSVNRLARAGELAIVDGEITADEARRWLGARGVEPYKQGG